MEEDASSAARQEAKQTASDHDGVGFSIHGFASAERQKAPGHGDFTHRGKAGKNQQLRGKQQLTAARKSHLGRSESASLLFRGPGAFLAKG